MQAPDITAGRGGLSALQATKSIYDLWNTRREIALQRASDEREAELHNARMQSHVLEMEAGRAYPRQTQKRKSQANGAKERRANGWLP